MQRTQRGVALYTVFDENGTRRGIYTLNLNTGGSKSRGRGWVGQGVVHSTASGPLVSIDNSKISRSEEFYFGDSSSQFVRKKKFCGPPKNFCDPVPHVFFATPHAKIFATHR